MEKIVTEVSIATITAPSSQSTNVGQKSRPIASECKICGASSVCVNYGSLSCASCKVFFKRHTKLGQESLKCKFGGHCKVNISNRHICTFCRLAKCFASGMQTEFMRCPRLKANTTKKKAKAMTTSTISVRSVTTDQPQQLATLNLLRSDHSTLSDDQWSRLSNLIHCHDEHSGLAVAQRFMNEQNALPPKSRFKCSSIIKFNTTLTSKILLLYEKNGDFRSLCSHDRSTLLRNTVKYTGGVGATLVLHQTELLNDPCFYNSSEIVFGKTAVMNYKHITDQLDSDISFVKLAVSIVAFSTTSYTVYNNAATVDLVDRKTIIRIQDAYTELAWRYLIYRYGHNQAILCFSNLIRCLFRVNLVLAELDDVKEYTDLIDTVVEQTEQTLVMDG